MIFTTFCIPKMCFIHKKKGRHGTHIQSQISIIHLRRANIYTGARGGYVGASTTSLYMQEFEFQRKINVNHLPWYVVKPATDGKHPLIQCLERLHFLSIKIQEALSMERCPAHEKGDDNGGCEGDEEINIHEMRHGTAMVEWHEKRF